MYYHRRRYFHLLDVLKELKNKNKKLQIVHRKAKLSLARARSKSEKAFREEQNRLKEYAIDNNIEDIKTEIQWIPKVEKHINAHKHYAML